MSDDVLITPGSRKIEFKDSSANVDAKIETDSSGNLIITNTGGDITIGDTTSDIFVGDGTANVDIVFEQAGEIRGTTGVTVTLGASDSNIRMATDLNLNSNNITNVNDLTITGNLNITGDINSYNVTDLDVTDKTITVGAGQTEANSGGSGLIVDGSGASLLWDEGDNYWAMNKSLAFDDTVTTTNQALGIKWTGFDKEGTTDFSDSASIVHTVNTGGHSGSVLLIQSQNDSGDGIAFVTNASSYLKHNSSNILTAANAFGQLGITSTAAELNKLDGYTGSVTELNYLDTLHATGVTSTEFDYLDGVTSNIQTQLNSKQASGSYLTSSSGLNASNLTSGTVPSARISHSTFDVGDTTAETGRTVKETGLYTYNVMNNNLGSGTDTSYYSVLTYGQGTGGSAQIATQWTSNGNKIYFRSLRDTTDNWWSWKEFYHTGHKPTYSELGTMAYSNLTGTPTIPTNNNQLTNGASYITSSDASITNKLPLAGGTMTGNINLNGSNLTGINYLQFENEELTTMSAAYQMVVDANDTDSNVPNHGNTSGSGPFGIYFTGDNGSATTTLGSGLVKVWHTGHFTKAHIDYFVGLYNTGVTTTEFDKLDGLTATTTELNYTDGVTSNIQTQLNGKQASGSYLTSSSGLNASNLTSGTVSTARLAHPTSGNWWKGGPPLVATDGVMEIGKYIDFHNTDTTTADLDTRLYSSGSNQLTINGSGRIFTDGYHPNADTLTTARTISLTGAVTGSTSFDGSGNVSIATTATADPTLTLSGDASGSATFTNLGNATLSVTVADDSHNHVISNVDGLQTALNNKIESSYTGFDSRYYTESEMQTYFRRGYIEFEGASALAVGWYTVATNTGDRAIGDFTLWDTDSSDHQGISFKASHFFGTDNSNDITVLHYAKFSGSPIRYIRIKDGGTYDGAALQVYIDQTTNNVGIAITGGNPPISGWVLKDWIPDATDPGDLTSYGSMGERVRVDLDLIANGGQQTSGAVIIGNPTNVLSDTNLSIYQDSATADQIKFYDGTTRMGEIGTQDTTWLRINNHTSKNIYTPRYIRADNGFFVDGNSKGINGSGNFVGGTITGASDANVSNWDTAYSWGNHASAGYITGNQTITLSGDVSGSGTTSISVTVADDSHNHIISNVDGLQTALDAKMPLSGGTFTGAVTIQQSGTPVLSLYDSGNAGGGGASGKILFSNTGGNAMGIGYTGNSTADSDMIISTNAAGTYGGYLSLAANGITDSSADIILEPKGSVRIAGSGNLQMGTTTVIDSSRNLTNIGTISSGRVTTSEDLRFSGTPRIRADNEINFLTIAGAAQTGKFLSVTAQTAYNSNSASSGMFNALNGYAVGTGNGTTVIDSSRNLTNIGSIAATSLTINGQQVINSSRQISNVGTISSGVHTVSSSANNPYMTFQVSGVTRGRIGVDDTTTANIYFSNSDSSSSGIGLRIEGYINTNKIVPCYGDGTETNNLTDLGATNQRWKNIYAGSNIYAGADVVAYSSSDERLKDNLEKIQQPIEKIQKISGYEFDWNDNQDIYEGHDIGVVAQEVEKVLPEIVETRENGYKAVKYEKMVALLIEGMKEQQEQIKDLQQEIKHLKENKNGNN